MSEVVALLAAVARILARAGLVEAVRPGVDAPDGWRAADHASDADFLLLHGNGAVATGPGPCTALVRAYYLEERAGVAATSGLEGALPPGDEWPERARRLAADTEPAWQWLAWRLGDEAPYAR